MGKLPQFRYCSVACHCRGIKDFRSAEAQLTLPGHLLLGYNSWRTCSTSSSFSPSSGSETVGHYDHLVQCGSLREDAQQRHVLQQLAQLQHTLKTYSNSMYLNPPPQRLDPKDDKSQHQEDKDPTLRQLKTNGAH
ncbi:hypothetical protein INR49_028582 [Caranx melampygus]|nr:hypothetical protein INR49_028582 [Caranx melampygus]